jgi:hypothetical protein
VKRFLKERRESKFEFRLCFGCGEALAVGGEFERGWKGVFVCVCLCVVVPFGLCCVDTSTYLITPNHQSLISRRGCVYFWNHVKKRHVTGKVYQQERI